MITGIYKIYLRLTFGGNGGLPSGNVALKEKHMKTITQHEPYGMA